jgi:hypothetical protein
MQWTNNNTSNATKQQQEKQCDELTTVEAMGWTHINQSNVMNPHQQKQCNKPPITKATR